MEKKVKVFKRMPNGKYISLEKTYNTTYKMNPKTGQMMGRKDTQGKGDGTGIRRVKEDFVIVDPSKDGRNKGYNRKFPSEVSKSEAQKRRMRLYESGEIIGRW